MSKLNQKGMSSIIFAMVFVIILSLLAVGFTTLVRNDQQQVLDKTLSFQAQYAAEAAINRKGAELIDAAATGTPVADSVGCPNLQLNSAGFSASADVTCITWTSSADSIVKDSLGTDPYITKLNTTGFTSSRLTFTWQSSNAAITANYGAAGANLPSINNANIPIVRVTVADKNLGGLTHMYFVPANAGAAIVGAVDGQVSPVACNAAGLCQVSFVYSTDSAWLSMMAYGGSANVTVEARDDATSALRKLVGAQALIDANARSQDVTKRIQARVPLVSQTWAPGFVLSAKNACKDFRVDGAQVTAASAPANTVCN
jgi:Tfp pilus assembly protein PilX